MRRCVSLRSKTSRVRTAARFSRDYQAHARGGVHLCAGSSRSSTVTSPSSRLPRLVRRRRLRLRGRPESVLGVPRPPVSASTGGALQGRRAWLERERSTVRGLIWTEFDACVDSGAHRADRDRLGKRVDPIAHTTWERGQRLAVPALSLINGELWYVGLPPLQVFRDEIDRIHGCRVGRRVDRETRKRG